MFKMSFFVFCLIGIATLQGAHAAEPAPLFGGDLPTTLRGWTIAGKAIVSEADGGVGGKVLNLICDPGTDNGIWSSFLTTEKGKNYQLTLKYRSVSQNSPLRIIVKHGDNTYSLLEKMLPPSQEWTTFTQDVPADTKPGGHASVWILSTGSVQLAEIYWGQAVDIETLAIEKQEAEKPQVGSMVLFGGNLPSGLSAWKTIGKAKASELKSSEGFTSLKLSCANGSDNGLWCESLRTSLGKSYLLKLRYRSLQPNSGLRLIVKHGDNTYSLYEKRFPPANEWQTVTGVMKETLPGEHSSLWILSDGEIEVANVSWGEIKGEGELAIEALLKPGIMEVPKVGTWPDLSKTLCIMQEWHLWFAAPVSEKGSEEGYLVWGDESGSQYELSSGPLWRRGFDDLIYPYLGPYSANNPEIIRWQIRVMKNAGLDGTTCQMYPNSKNGKTFFNLETFEQCLKTAEEEGYSIGIHDEIQFMPAEAQSVDAFIERASNALALAKKYPKGYLRIDGKPIYQFESFGLANWSVGDFKKMIEGVETKLGEGVYWMSSGPPKTLLAVDKFSALKGPSDFWALMRKEGTTAYGSSGEFNFKTNKILPFNSPEKTTAVNHLYESYAKAIEDGNAKRTAPVAWVPWLYPGYNNAVRVIASGVIPDAAFDRDAYLQQTLQDALKHKPKIINFASWNDRNEKTCWEPSWSNENEDPFHLVKLIAEMKRKTFVEPSLPPKEYVDPWLWSILYGIDRTPPRIIGLRAHPSEGTVSIDAIDDKSGIASYKLSASPLGCWGFLKNYQVNFGGSLFVWNAKTEDDAWSLTLDSTASFIIKMSQEITLSKNPWFAIKYKIPAGYAMRARFAYPIAPSNFTFRLNNEKATPVPTSIFLYGNGLETWHVIQLPYIKFNENNRDIAIYLTLIALDKTAPLGSAKVQKLVLFPNEISNESSRLSQLPYSSPLFKTAILELPYRLMPRNFIDIPIAAQVVDKEGNFSPLTVFDITADDLRLKPDAVDKDSSVKRWGGKL